MRERNQIFRYYALWVTILRWISRLAIFNSGVLVEVKTKQLFRRFSRRILDENRKRIVVLRGSFSGQKIVSLFSCDYDNTCLQDDRHIGGVEQFDWVFSLLSSVLGITDWKIHSPS